MNPKSRVLTIILIACLVLSLTTPPLFSQQDFTPARVKDISDRAYEPAVIELLDGSKKSIVISMYNISLFTKEKNPIRLLFKDLLEARRRGVKVTLYLNTRFKNTGKNPHRVIDDPEFNRLKESGCSIHLVPPRYRLHDKLIIVDGRYVVESSLNWSISALRGNFESATLIDSPGLAKAKLLRLKTLPLTSKPITKPRPEPFYLDQLPRNITLSKSLLLDKRYFPQMLTRHDDRRMDLYLLLLAHSQITGKREFFVDIEAMALSLGLPDSWSNTALRRQAIKSLKILNKRYNLIDVKFFHGKNAWVELLDLPRDTFTISSTLITSDDLSMRLKFVLLVKSLLESQGEDIHSISGRLLAERFGIHHTTMNAALKELRQNK